MAGKDIRLKVAEAIQDDVNKGIVRIDSNFMQELGVRVGDIVALKGERETVAIIDRAYPGDIGLNIIRMDGIIRKNAKTGIGELVEIKKIEVKEAKKVIIAPTRKDVKIRAPPELFKNGLLGRAAVKGDIVALGGQRRRRTTLSDSPFFDDVFSGLFDDPFSGFGFGDLKFVVVDSSPKGAVIVSEHTEVVFNPEAVEVTEEVAPEVSYEDIGGLDEEIKKIREMVELPLKHPEIFERLGIEPPKGVLLHGPPGTGKTLLAKAVAAETNSNFILINGPEIMSKYYGQSLPADEKILIREKGLFKRVPIGEIVEKNRKDIEAVCFDNKGKVTIKKVSALIRHKLRSKIMEVRTASGRRIKVTDDHSLFSLGKKGIVDIKTSQLISNKSYIAVPKIIPFNPNPIDKLDLFDMLKNEDYGIVIRGIQNEFGEAIKRLGIKKIAEILNVREKYIYDIKSKNVGIGAKKCYNLMKEANLDIDKDFLQISTKGKSMPSVLKLTEDIMLFFGLWMAEGSYTNKNEVRLSVHRDEEKFVADLCRKLFGMVTIYRKKNSLGSDIYICSGILGKIMKNVLGFNSGARFKKIPDFVYNLSKLHLSAFLRGFISGDGSLNLTTPAPMVEVVSESPSLADDITYLLLHFGIVAKIYTRKNRPQKRICFADYENLEKFMDIGFINSNKNKAIGSYLNLQKFSRRDQFPITSEIKKIVESNPELSAWKKSCTIGKNVLQKLEDPSLRLLLENDIKWDKVVSVKEVSEKPEYVYDLSVPGAENFISGFGGIYAHNSEENLRKKFEEAAKNSPSIIFIDEIDAIAAKREETKGEVERRVVAQLLANMDGLQSRGKVVVIAATNIPNALDPALRRPGRFDREIEIGVPGKEGRLKVLKIHTRNMPLYKNENALHEIEGMEDNYKSALYALRKGLRGKTTKKALEVAIQKYLKDNPEKNELFKGIDIDKLLKYNNQINANPNIVYIDELAEITHGFVGADLAALARESAMVVLRRVLPDLKLKEEETIPKEMLEKLLITQSDFREALKVVRPSALREVFVEKPDVKWEDIGGLEEVKQELIEAVEWPLKHPESFTRMGVKPPKGVLVYGAPGTGKTLLAKAVANESNANFIAVKGPEMLSKWVGESEKAVREVFKKARQTSPTIIFFDEIDSLAPRRGMHEGGSHVNETVVNQLLTEMDGLEEMNDVVIIAATNRPDIIDTSLLRPGRFDRVILAGAPDEKSRLEIFKVHTKGMPLIPTKEEIKELDKKEKETNDIVKVAERITGKEDKRKEIVKDYNKMSDTQKMLYFLTTRTEGYVGADIEAVCREAAILALRDDINAKAVTLKNFEEALEKVGPSSTKDVEKAYEELGKQFSAAKGKQMKEEMPNYFG